MPRRILTGSFVVLVFLFLLIGIAGAQDSYTIKYSTEKERHDYTTDTKVTFNLHADDLPLPGAIIDIRNIQMSSLGGEYVEITGYDKESNCLTMLVGSSNDCVRIGYDFFQLPPMKDLMEEFARKADKNKDKFDLMFSGKQESTLKITPEGKLMGMETDLPPEAPRQAAMLMPIVMNSMTRIIGQTFPGKPVKIGESWTQEMSLDQIPMAQMPKLIVEYRLEGVERTKDGRDIGRISCRSRWHYDPPNPDKFIKKESIEYWKGDSLEVTKLRPWVEILVDGKFLFDITGGFIVDYESTSQIAIDIQVDLKKKSGYNAEKTWSPNVEFTMITNEVGKLK